MHSQCLNRALDNILDISCGTVKIVRTGLLCPFLLWSNACPVHLVDCMLYLMSPWIKKGDGYIGSALFHPWNTHLFCTQEDEREAFLEIFCCDVMLQRRGCSVQPFHL
uniref:Uncharacterized protein n=1 Tax=Anguilla anguilla TaxID=7936 RepID=A0A0E9X577_ANGAN